MMENQKLEDMAGSCDDLKGTVQKIIYVAHRENGLQYSSNEADSFVVDMERFSQLIEKDTTATSRITLQRNLSRKGSVRGGDKQFNSTNSNERDASFITTSPKVSTLQEGNSMPEKPTIVSLGPTDHSVVPQVHHHITITNNSMAPETKFGGKRFSFRRSPHSSSFNPRQILFFFASLSSVGTVLLIYFTLSMSKFNSDSA